MAGVGEESPTELGDVQPPGEGGVWRPYMEERAAEYKV